MPKTKAKRSPAKPKRSTAKAKRPAAKTKPSPAKTKNKPKIAASDDALARDIMTEDPMVVDADATLADAFAILSTLEVRHLPVLQGTTLVGMLSDRDVQPHLGTEEAMQRRVATVMNTNVISVEPDATVKDVASALVDNRIGAVPVVEGHDGDVLGIISYVDILRAFAAAE